MAAKSGGPDLFQWHATDTDWEWADRRRRWFKTPMANVVVGSATFAVGMTVRGLVGDPNWFVASFVSFAVAVITALLAPKAETAIIFLRRHKIRLEELQARDAGAAEAPVAPPAART